MPSQCQEIADKLIVKVVSTVVKYLDNGLSETQPKQRKRESSGVSLETQSETEVTSLFSSVLLFQELLLLPLTVFGQTTTIHLLRLPK